MSPGTNQNKLAKKNKKNSCVVKFERNQPLKKFSWLALPFSVVYIHDQTYISTKNFLYFITVGA